jgi:leucyl-tRNA synthetase
VGYHFKEIEEKWQTRWDKMRLGEIDIQKSLDDSEDPFYILTMFPYPSGDKLHLGHWWQYGIMDSWSRFQRMNGKKVFQPMGFDAFGLPAENFAIKKGVHPNTSTANNVSVMMNQFKKMGVSYAWDNYLNTSDPNYYKWTQWLFLQLYKTKLAYRKHAPVNWCLNCQTVLANEQVNDGECERCSSQVIKKNMKQWFFNITKYADNLLDGLKDLDWPSKTVAMQKNWIGKSEGALINFKIDESDTSIDVFTTRPDTLHGVTYVVLAPENPLVEELTTSEFKEKVLEYVEATSKLSDIERLADSESKSGVKTGAYAINPINQERVPIWIGDYVLASYGTGAVMAVPGHDQRDFEFAKKFNLPIKKVVLEKGSDQQEELSEAFVGSGEMVNSGSCDGISNTDAKEKIVSELFKADKGKKHINYRLRDWLVSRQRYWGSPIPIVYCDSCGEVPVPESDLPVQLPEDVDFKPGGESPLKKCASFMNTTCPTCKGPATREADTLDTFVCSSWYFLRFPNVGNDKVAFDTKLTNSILPVDRYCGGPEHACMHLLYARFITMFLKDQGLINFSEPFKSLTHQGLILGPDGNKMSKSKNNSVSPDSYVEEYGSDVLRLYLMFGFNFIDGGPWADEGFKAIVRFSNRLWSTFEEREDLMKDKSAVTNEFSKEDKKLLSVFHNTIKMATDDTDRFMFNTTIARFMELLNALGDYKKVPEEKVNKGLLRDILNDFVILLAPFAPHFSEEWHELVGNTDSVFNKPWPSYDEKFLILDEIEMAVMINGKFRSRITIASDAVEDVIKAEALKANGIAKYTDGTNIVKTIVIPKKLINLIVK